MVYTADSKSAEGNLLLVQVQSTGLQIMFGEATIEKNILLLQYYGAPYFSVPYYNLQMPREAEGDNFRPDRQFRFVSSGEMIYLGKGRWREGYPDITVMGIKPDKAWTERIYIELGASVKVKVRASAKKSLIRNTARLIMKFNKIDFIYENYLETVR